MFRVLAIVLAASLPLLVPSYQPSLRDHQRLSFASNGVAVIARRIGAPPKTLRDDIIVRIEAWQSGHRVRFEFQNRSYKTARGSYVDIEGKDVTAYIVPRVSLRGHTPDVPVIVALTRTCGGSCGDWASVFEAHRSKGEVQYEHPREAYLSSPGGPGYAEEWQGAHGRVLRVGYVRRINGNTFLTGVFDSACRSFGLVVDYPSSMVERDEPSGRALRSDDYLELHGDYVRVLRPPKPFSCSREGSDT